MMHNPWLTAVVDEEGNRLAVFKTKRQAAEWAGQRGEEVYEVAQYGGLDELEANPQKAPDEYPEFAWRSMGYLHVREEQIRDLKLEDAVARLRQLKMPDTGADWLLGVPRNRDGTVWVMPRQKMIFVREGDDSRGKKVLGPDGEPLMKLVPLKNTVDDFVRQFLASNDKMAKDHPGIAADILGLSMLPANYVSRRGGPGANALHGAGEVSAADVLPHVFPRGVTLCRGSNEQCRKSCLVFSGHNDLQRHNRRKKEALTVAFFMDPVAFCRVLLAAILKFTGTWSRTPGKGRRKLHPFCRLNVFSDVPWELVCPSLFRLTPNTDYYDYTKVPSRPEMCAQILASRSSARRPMDVMPFPDNYHLTFSASGDNDWHCYSEMQRGRKVAVVFETDRHRTPTWYSPAFWPQEAWFPVIPGDVSDVRPVDPTVEALAQAIQKLGEPDADWKEERLKKYQAKLTGEAYKLTFGRKGAGRSLADMPETGAGIVGLHHKPPVVPEARERQRGALEKRRLKVAQGRTEGRLFLVGVKQMGTMIVAKGCPPTVAFGKAVVPEDQPLVRRITRRVQRAVPAAAKRRARRASKEDQE